MKPEPDVVVGKIVGVHGIKGHVKLLGEADAYGGYVPGLSVTVRDKEGRHFSMQIADAAPKGRILLIRFEGIDDRSAAETLMGADLLVARSMLPALEPDTYYWADIEGMSVITVDGRTIGTVSSLMETGSNDVYGIQTPEGGEILIPALASVILDIDLEQKIMRVNLPEGLE